MLEKPKINEKEAVVGPFLKRPFRLSVVDHIVVWDNCRDALVMLSTYMHAAAAKKWPELSFSKIFYSGVVFKVDFVIPNNDDGAIFQLTLWESNSKAFVLHFDQNH